MNVNPNVTIQERTLIIENIKKFLMDHLPSDQMASPQKAHELAVRFENHVVSSTGTKEQYHGMIEEKLRLIKIKSNEPSPSLSTQSAQTTHTTHSAHSAQSFQSTQSSNSSQSTLLSTIEISQITTRLLQIRPQVPQIDKLISLHSKLPIPPPNTPEMVKKLSDCRNVLVNQMEMSTGVKKSFFMNLEQLNLLIEQVQRLFNSLVTKMKESAGVNGVLTVNSPMSSTNSAQLSIPKPPLTIPLNNSNSISSSISNSSIVSKNSFKYQTNNSVKSLNSSLMNQSNREFEKILSQRLAMPSDDFEISNSRLAHDSNWIARFISNISSGNGSNDYYIGNSRKRKYLLQRDSLLKNELKYLKDQGYRINLQETGLGTLSVLVHLIRERVRVFFQISPIYPYDQLIYRIEKRNLPDSPYSCELLPVHLEPKTFPLNITNILRNYQIAMLNLIDK